MLRFTKSAAILELEKGDEILSVNSEKINNDLKILLGIKVDFRVEFGVMEIRETMLKPLIVDVPAEAGGFDRIYKMGMLVNTFLSYKRKRQY